MKIQSNTAAMAAQRNLGASDSVLGKSIGKLSSGYRLNKASDDAAGMGIANKIRADLRALSQASRNASQATALVQVAEGAVGTISNILDRMKELAVQSASDSVTDTDRGKIQSEYSALQSEINRITDNTQYQKQTLLKGTYGLSQNYTGSTATSAAAAAALGIASVDFGGASALTTYVLTVVTGATVALRNGAGAGSTTQTLAFAAGTQTYNFDKLGIRINTNALGALEGANGNFATSTANGGTFQVGTDNAADSKIGLTLGDLTVTGLTINAALGTTISSAQTAVSALDIAIGKLNDVIGTIGAASNRFDYAMQNLQSIMENMGAAESVIRDADVGQEMTTFTKNQILQQAGTAMLAQANSAPQSVLSLLKG